MFSKNTFFLLGAGASKPYGFPLGAEFIGNILQDMKDEIYFYCSEEQAGYCGGKEAAGYKWLRSNATQDDGQLRQIRSDMTNHRSQARDSRDPWGHTKFVAGTCFYFHREIKNIFAFEDLYKALIYFSPVSIDAFLRDNPCYEEAGKIMIAYSLLKREDKRLFESSSDNWYSCFLNDLSSGCSDDPEQLLENKINIITFNYDCSLDYRLQAWLRGTEIFNSSDSSIANKFLEQFKIDHVYGGLNNLNKADYRYGYYGSLNVNEGDEEIELNFKRFLQAIHLGQCIKVMYKDRRDDSEFKQKQQDLYEKLKQAEEIVFIGFGFDRDNLDQLGLPRAEKEWLKFCENKTIRWLNYKGDMTGLSKQFNKLDRLLADKGSIIESSATDICSAYQNDFKIFLF